MINVVCIICQQVYIFRLEDKNEELEDELHQARLDAINEINKLRKED